MILLTKSIQFNNDLSISVSDIKGAGIEKTHIYLTKVCGLEMPTNSIQWQNIKNCNHIRNCIVHNGGDIEEYPKKAELRKVIESFEHIYERGNYRIYLDRDFCTGLINDMEWILQDLYMRAIGSRLLPD